MLLKVLIAILHMIIIWIEWIMDGMDYGLKVGNLYRRNHAGLL